MQPWINTKIVWLCRTFGNQSSMPISYWFNCLFQVCCWYIVIMSTKMNMLLPTFCMFVSCRNSQKNNTREFKLLTSICKWCHCSLCFNIISLHCTYIGVQCPLRYVHFRSWFPWKWPEVKNNAYMHDFRIVFTYWLRNVSCCTFTVLNQYRTVSIAKTQPLHWRNRTSRIAFAALLKLLLQGDEKSTHAEQLWSSRQSPETTSPVTWSSVSINVEGRDGLVKAIMEDDHDASHLPVPVEMRTMANCGRVRELEFTGNYATGRVYRTTII